MGKEGQQVEGGQKVGQMLRAVGKVMVEMIAVILEDIVVFILYFPTGAACRDGLHDIGFINGVRCGPRIAVDKLLFGIGDGDFAPVHQQGVYFTWVFSQSTLPLFLEKPLPPQGGHFLV